MNIHEKKSRDNYNRIADNYDQSFDGRVTIRFKYFLLEEKIVNRKDTVLDVACGNGTLLKMLDDRWEIQGYGMDLSEKMIENARRKCPHMTFEVHSCERSNFTSQFFDVITVCAAYHHFPDVKAFAQEANRLLKVDGLLYIADVYYPYFRGLANLLLPLSKAGDVKCYSPKEIRVNFEAFGFEQVAFRKRWLMQIVTLRKVENLASGSEV